MSAIGVVPGAINRLVEMLQVLDLDDTAVLDGPQVSGDYKEAVIIVGHFVGSQGDFPAPIATTEVAAPAGLASNDTTVSVIALAVSVLTEPLRSARDRIAEIVSAVHQMLMSDPTLGGVVPQATLGSSAQWWYIPGANGVEVAWRGEIRIRGL